MSTWTLSPLLQQGNMTRATELINRAAVRKVSLLSLLQDKFVDPDDKRLDCEIISIKCYRPSRPKRRGQLPMDQPYNRLVLCRDMDSGRGFYIKVVNDAEALKLFALTKCPYIGHYFTIYEPYFGRGAIHGVPYLNASNPFIPITPTLVGRKITGRPVVLSNEVTVVTFLEECNDLHLAGCSIQRACPMDACNGCHTEVQCLPCPAVKSSSKLSSFTFSALLSSQHLQMEGNIASRSLGLLFFEPDSFTDEVDSLEVRRVANAALQHYREAGVPFLLAGRFKDHQDEEEVAAQIKTLYFSSVRPLRILDNFDKYSLLHRQGAGVAPGAIALGPSRPQFVE